MTDDHEKRKSLDAKAESIANVQRGVNTLELNRTGIEVLSAAADLYKQAALGEIKDFDHIAFLEQVLLLAARRWA